MIEMVRREIARALAGVRSAVRARLQVLDLAKRIQRVQAEALAGETLQGMELMQQFGFTSAPPADTQLIVLPLGGRTSAGVIVATENGAYRFQLGAQGEAALYNQWGDVVHMRQDRTIHMVAAVQVTVDAPVLQVNGEIRATGHIKSDADVLDHASTTPKSMRGMRQTYDGHTHTENNNLGGPTSVTNQLMGA